MSVVVTRMESVHSLRQRLKEQALTFLAVQKKLSCVKNIIKNGKRRQSKIEKLKEPDLTGFSVFC